MARNGSSYSMQESQSKRSRLSSLAKISSFALQL